MPDSGDQPHVTGPASPAPGIVSSWNPEGDPIEAFETRIDQALRPLSLELAAIRAERDGLRLELEGVRAQYEMLRQQLSDRDRFATSVRELSEIVRHLTLPPRWAGNTEVPDAPRQPLAPPPAYHELPYQPPYQQPAPRQHALPPYEHQPPAAPQYPQQPTGSAESGRATPGDAPAGAGPGDPGEVDWTTYLSPSHTTGPPPVPPPQPAAAPEPAPQPTPPPGPPTPLTIRADAADAPDREVPIEAGDTTVPLDWVSYLAEQSPAADAAPPIGLHEAPAGGDTESSRPRAPAPEFRIDKPYAMEPSLSPATRTWEIPTGGAPRQRRPRPNPLRTWATRIGSVVVGLVVLVILIVSIGPKFLPYQTFFVRSGSMEPSIEVGEMIFLTKVHASDLDVGDVITFERPDKPDTFVTHRIVALESSPDGQVFQTKGDANASPDSWRVPASGDGWKVAFGIPKMGYLFGYLGTAQARLALLAVPAVILGVLSLVDIWKPSPRAAARRR